MYIPPKTMPEIPVVYSSQQQTLRDSPKKGFELVSKESTEPPPAPRPAPPPAPKVAILSSCRRWRAGRRRFMATGTSPGNSRVRYN